ncbi:MAG: hypothetical protein JWN78_556 [Bacteroidota bacterium]|nr:hypothetical protein [Bacteroidota bacterium]
MTHLKFIARLLFYLSRAASWLYLLIGSYTFIVISALKVVPSASLYFQRLDNNRFFIFYPFTDIPFLTGEFSNFYFGTLLLILFGYGIFLWLLSNVFYAFTQEKLFTKEAIRDLTIFYKINLVIPGLIVIVFALCKQGIDDLIIITCLHFVIGIFAYFMAAMFKQGWELQEEQDLTL